MVRGNADGLLIVSPEINFLPSAEILARIPITPGIEWHEAGAKFTSLYGKAAFYFTYQGEGILDFKSFTLG
jgi:hypothetical protein